jgi:hypothetical protein
MNVQIRNGLSGKEVINFSLWKLVLIISIGYYRHIHCLFILIIKYLIARGFIESSEGV